MRVLASLLLLTFSQSAAGAATLTQDMTCAALIASFEKTGTAYKLVNGKVLPLRQGMPIRKALGLRCGPNNYQRQNVVAQTLDQRQCVYAVYCHGFDNDRSLTNR